MMINFLQLFSNWRRRQLESRIIEQQEMVYNPTLEYDRRVYHTNILNDLQGKYVARYGVPYRREG
jgi:hypothetical protein